MGLIDYIGPDRSAALRKLAARIDASDDTAVLAWAAWQSFASLPAAERTQALGIVIALEEIKRASEGLPPNFTTLGKYVPERTGS
jgi:hypothetical protein